MCYNKKGVVHENRFKVNYFHKYFIEQLGLELLKFQPLFVPMIMI